MIVRLRRYGFVVSVLLLGVWIALLAALLLTIQSRSSDWSTYYDAARAIRLTPHANLWDHETIAWNSQQPGGCALWSGVNYRYPPLLAMLIAPLTNLPCAGATLVWRVLTLGLFAVCAAGLTIGPWRADSFKWALATVAIVSIYFPLIDGMLLGQVSLLILASVLTGAILVVHGHETWGGAVLAAGAWIKYVPGAVVVYYALTGRWRVALGAAVSGAALLVAQVVIAGPASVTRSFAPAMEATDTAIWANLPGGAWWGVGAGALYAAAIACTRRRTVDIRVDALGVSWTLCTVLLMAPVVWWLYLTWLLPAFVTCLAETARWDRAGLGAPGWKRWALLAVLACLFAISLIPYNHISISVSVFGVWIICGALYLRRMELRVPLFARRSTADQQIAA